VARHARAASGGLAWHAAGHRSARPGLERVAAARLRWLAREPAARRGPGARLERLPAARRIQLAASGVARLGAGSRARSSGARRRLAWQRGGASSGACHGPAALGLERGAAARVAPARGFAPTGPGHLGRSPSGAAALWRRDDRERLRLRVRVRWLARHDAFAQPHAGACSGAGWRWLGRRASLVASAGHAQRARAADGRPRARADAGHAQCARHRLDHDAQRAPGRSAAQPAAVNGWLARRDPGGASPGQPSGLAAPGGRAAAVPGRDGR
jgi:hypothetical protein